MPVEKTIHLLSSGIDSPVAGYLLIQAGIEPIFLFFDANPYNTERTKQVAIKLASKLATIAGHSFKMYIAPHGGTMSAMKAAWTEAEQKYSCLFCKRIYYRIAVEIAKLDGAQAISTGEIIGEQASQTIDNMTLIQDAIGTFLIVRPLLTMDKQQVIDIARNIGTLEISNESKDPCQLAPKFPITHGRIETYKKIEEKIDVPALLQKVMYNLEIIDILPADIE
jgi:thiamine biosynthesis protein ThiI